MRTGHESISEQPRVSYDDELKKITVRGADVFPEQVYDYADRAEIMDMSHGGLTTLPDDMSRFTKLKAAFFSFNPFEELPESLAACESLETVGLRDCNISSFGGLPPNIRALILTNNHITQLPSGIGAYKALQKLSMTGNELRDLPQELLGCHNLELVRFGTNKLAKSPDWLFRLPRLAWYADGDNPLSPHHEVQPAPIEWSSITLGAQLGKSSNNEVYHGRLQDGREVAVKLFGHTVSTDGSSESDIMTCLRAGEHPNVVGGMGKLVNAPDNRLGMVMSFIPADFTQLGNPHNLDTVSRDTYPPGTSHTLDFMHNVAADVSAGMAHLHSLGIMHGDLYAHNVVADPEGHAKVGDFGAAALYVPGTPSGLLREKTDVRAFGHLLEELLLHCNEPNVDYLSYLMTLRRACLDENIDHVPLFANIHNYLNQASRRHNTTQQHVA